MPRTPFIEPLEARIAPATLSIANASLVEGNSGIKYMTFTLSLDAAVSNTITFHYSTHDGTATAGSDYVAATDVKGTLFAGQTTETIRIAIKGDANYESNETFTLSIDDAVQAGGGSVTLPSSAATGTIINDDPHLISGTDLQYYDTDGDLVTVHFSKSILTAKNVGKAFTFKPSFASGDDQDMQLQSIDLSKLAGVAGSDLTISVTTKAGDGVVDVGQIIGSVNMGTVEVDGDLGRFVLGSGTGKAFTKLEMDSLGVASDTGASNIASSFAGNAGEIDINGNVENATLVFAGKLDTLNITGTLGTADSASGSSVITINGKLGDGTIGGIIGGTDGNSGEITGGSKSAITGTLTINGSITGGGNSSGVILVNDINSLVVTGGITGGIGDGSSSSTNNGTNSGVVIVDGKLGSLEVDGSITGASAGTGTNNGLVYAGTLGEAVIKGGITGGGGSVSGGIFAGAITTSLTVGTASDSSSGNVTGGAGLQSGIIYIWGNAKEINLTGSLTGGSGSESGSIEAGSIDTLSIAGSIKGSTGTKSGRVYTSGDLGVIPTTTTTAAAPTSTTGTVTIGGNITGGSANDSGEIMVGGTLSAFTLSGNLTGGNSTPASTNSTALLNSGYIQATHMGDLMIDGDVNAGTDNGAGIGNSGAIRATYEMGSLTVNGSLNGSAANAVIISAGGQQHVNLKATTPTDQAIGSITIGGSASYLEILAGYSTDATASNHRGSAVSADAQIGTVEVDGDFTGSSIVAGALPGGDTYFGNSGTVTDTKILAGPDYSKIVSSIASVIIKGSVASGSGTSYGIVAQQVGSVTVGSESISLTAGASNDTTPIAIDSTNLSVLEIAQ